ncbi:hypothetical protein AMECASPLE_039486 [Ameca splendens]|uniref:Uncharacterized protein n=1 Tax=Ameca splendens TaxID=208324 RepID=A0ABV0XLV0_9TELE
MISSHIKVTINYACSVFYPIDRTLRSVPFYSAAFNYLHSVSFFNIGSTPGPVLLCLCGSMLSSLTQSWSQQRSAHTEPGSAGDSFSLSPHACLGGGIAAKLDSMQSAGLP